MRKIVFILLAVVICFSPVGVSSQNIFQKAANKISSWFSGGEKERASDKTGHIDITQLTLDENLSIPDLGKQARKIRTAQSREMKRLQKARLSDLKLIRNYEVLKATLSASNLFLPNDTVLSDRADIYLRPFLAALRVPDFYHVMLVMHSDDTGSEAYSLDLTRALFAIGLREMEEIRILSLFMKPVRSIRLLRMKLWKDGHGIVASIYI